MYHHTTKDHIGDIKCSIGSALLKKGIGQIFKDGCGKCDQKDFSDQVFLDQHTV